MSIMDMFRGIKVPGQPATAPAPTAATPAVAAAQTASAAGNPSVPSPATPVSNGSVAAIPAVGTGEASPLAKFDDLWKTDPNQKQATTSIVPSFNMDPTRLQAAAAQLDFTKAIPAETMTKAMSGDAVAFAEVLNAVGRQSFAQGLAGSNELVKQSLTQAQTGLTDSLLPAALRQQQISQAIKAENPAFSSPAVAPMLKMLEGQLSAKYPTASAQEIAGLAKEYFSGVASQVVSGSGGTVVAKGQQPVPGQRMQVQETDWSDFAGIQL